MRLLLTLSVSALLFWGCEEISPVINPVMESENVCEAPQAITGQSRQVLVEEFTGVRCVNCPAGSAALEDLKGQYGEQLVAVSIHAGSFAPPYPESVDTLRTVEGEAILSFLGEPLGYPTAVVNRKKFPGGFNLQLPRNGWAGAIEQELQEAPRALIDINNTYDAATRTLDVCITLEMADDLNAEESVFLTVMLTENDVVDLQLTPESSEPDPNYVHKHVLRTMMTTPAGNLLQEDLSAGAFVQKSYSVELLEKWDAANCHVVAFVHLGGETKAVLQAAEEPL
ncbi:Omp28 family outer membrane lipoprotein [Phaeodactylibacter luteus]|uniref:Omp28 family outer membrane lipoprotein n=1 Tax=Phaeodactylibacter luteus TaxID=1564516 RepID=A0A5C6S0V2_9BACT|nr:Omp28 family outer membrane lipoprotein [Phaeodactylibacter luteus]TXB67993.1 Omp28 family outer membrane lipoprotein [Phaeodactylibacter luteus]